MSVERAVERILRIIEEAQRIHSEINEIVESRVQLDFMKGVRPVPRLCIEHSGRIARVYRGYFGFSEEPLDFDMVCLSLQHGGAEITFVKRSEKNRRYIMHSRDEVYSIELMDISTRIPDLLAIARNAATLLEVLDRIEEELRRRLEEAKQRYEEAMKVVSLLKLAAESLGMGR